MWTDCPVVSVGEDSWGVIGLLLDLLGDDITNFPLKIGSSGPAARHLTFAIWRLLSLVLLAECHGAQSEVQIPSS